MVHYRTCCVYWSSSARVPMATRALADGAGMTLDLDELTRNWDCPPGELRARTIIGRDGAELVQLRIDLGVMQMSPAGRPDGEDYRRLPTAGDYIRHELKAASAAIANEHWQELEREIAQTNYRRMAFGALADDALRTNDEVQALRFLRCALADIDTCLANLELLAAHGQQRGEGPSFRLSLVFDRARLSSQLRILEGRFDEAVEEADAGARALDDALADMGYDEERRQEEPSLVYLRRLGTHLRREYGISQTLAELLQEAVDNEDYETAAELRDELVRRRGQGDSPG